MSKPKKLTPAQEKVVSLMREGWELTYCLDTTGGGRYRLRRNLYGEFGETVGSSTVHGLYVRKIIRQVKREFPVTYYGLAE